MLASFKEVHVLTDIRLTKPHKAALLLISIMHWRMLKHREVQYLFQVHIADLWQTWNLESDFTAHAFNQDVIVGKSSFDTK